MKESIFALLFSIRSLSFVRFSLSCLAGTHANLMHGRKAESVLSHLVPSNPLKSRSSPLSPFAPLLSSQPSVIPSALIPLAQLYEKHLQSARYGKDEPTEEVYVEVIKIVAVFVGILGRKLE